jgi:hypothetical protein
MGAYLVWRGGIVKDGICKLEHGFSARTADGEQLSELVDDGRPCADRWPAGVGIPMDPSFKKDTKLVDCLNTGQVLIVSGRARAFLDDKKVTHVEYLPVRILDHAGKEASADYFIANPTAVVDCIDLDASEADRDDNFEEGGTNVITGCAQLILREDAIQSGTHVFRPRYWEYLTLIDRALADEMKAAGLQPGFREPEEYDGIG